MSDLRTLLNLKLFRMISLADHFVKLINQVTRNYEEIPTWKRLDDVVHTFWFRRRDAEPQVRF